MANVAKVALRFMVAASTTAPVPTGTPIITDIVVTFHIHAADAHDEFTEADREAFADVFATWWSDGFGDEDSLGSAYDPRWWLLDVTVINVEPAPSDATVVDVGTQGTRFPLLGDNAIHPPQNSLCITWVTLQDDRRGRGRAYLPPWSLGTDDDTAVGILAEASRDEFAFIVASVAQAIGALDGGPFALAVYSREDGDARSIIGFRLANRWRTQRRRAAPTVSYRAYDLSGDPIP